MAEAASTTDIARRAPGPRLPPHSIEAEQSVLGAVMLDHRAWERIADAVAADDFYRADHRLIFRTLAKLVERDQPPDAITVGEQLERQNQLDAAGGLAYIAQLVEATPSAANVRAYAGIVRDNSMLRQLIEIGGDIASSVYDNEGHTVSELVDTAERRVFEIADRGQSRTDGFVALQDVLPATIDLIDTLTHSKDGITGLATGFTALDEKTAGLQRGDLVVIAGRPSMGKTALAVNIAENAAIGKKVATAIFSMEMSAEQLVFRMIRSVGRVQQTDLQKANLTSVVSSRIDSAVDLLKAAPIFIDDSAALTPTEVRARARRLKREHNLGLIVVDYLQLMRVNTATENRVVEMSEISRSLKALAKELNLPVIALSQLNRGVESRNDKRPLMSDLRDSGAIEQDADLIVLIYREEYYNADTPRKGVADIIIGKQRNGPTGEFNLTFLGEFTKFENLVAEAYGDGVF
ncbi:replicative DNA helicase [Candidatus Rariloculus sp.]|uniref:replicative DNA helicase n=1 Tax=Candidatus Rariloculus sp. TaxID=3101265 RepID=UPI003D121BFA